MMRFIALFPWMLRGRAKCLHSLNAKKGRDSLGFSTVHRAFVSKHCLATSYINRLGITLCPGGSSPLVVPSLVFSANKLCSGDRS